MRYLAILFFAPLFFFDTSAFAQRFPAPRPAPIYRPPVTTRPNTTTVNRTNLPPINRPPRTLPRTTSPSRTTGTGQKSIPARNGNSNVVPLRTVTIPQRTAPVVASAKASNAAKLAQLRSTLTNRKKATATAGSGGRRPPGNNRNIAANDNRKIKTVEDILKNSSFGVDSAGRTRRDIRIKTGGMNQADADFDALNPINVKPITSPYGQGRTGTLLDGRKITVRSGSSDRGRPTLEISKSNGRSDKIRYDP